MHINIFLIIFYSFYFIPDEINGMEKNIFLSTKYDEVNIRKGPGKNHYVIGIFQKKGIPLKIIDSFDTWLKIKDYEGEIGWVSMSQLSEKKFGIILKEVKLQQFPKKNSKELALIKKNMLVKVKKCKNNWCQVNVKDFNGWIEVDKFWGAK